MKKTIIVLVAVVFAVFTATAGAELITSVPRKPADGIGDVSRASKLGASGNWAEGRAFIAGLRKNKDSRRNLEERQSVDMAEFAMLRHDLNANRKRCIECLRSVYDAGPSSFWGWAAYTYLSDLGVNVPMPPKDPLRGLGEFGDGVVNLKPKMLEMKTAGRIDSLRNAAKFDAATLNVSKLKPGSPVRRAILRNRLLKICGEKKVAEILGANGGAALFSRLWDDDATLEDFLLSGPVFNAPLALETLMTLFINDEKEGWTKTPMGRKASVAVAINAKDGDDMADTVRHWAAYRRIGMKGRFVKNTGKRDCREWRFIVRRPADPADTLFLNSRKCFPTRFRRNVGLNNVPYRKKNCFGISKWAKNDAFLKPWTASGWPRQYLRSRVGGVCTEQAMWAALSANAHGIMAERAGQPGHCCWLMRSEDGNWHIVAGIRPYTSGVFLLWGRGIQYIQSTERAFKDRARHDISELLRFAGRVKEAALYCPYNYPAWRDYTDSLKSGNASVEDWMKYLRELLEGAPEGRLVSWDFANEAIAAMAAKGASKNTLAKETARVFKGLSQPKSWIAEEMNYGRDAIGRFLKRFRKNDELSMKIMAVALEANDDSSKYLPQIFGYAFKRWSNDKAKLARFFDIAAKYAGGNDSDKMNWRRLSSLKGCMDDRATFRMMAAFRNADDPPKGAGIVAQEDYGASLASHDALVKISSSGKGDTPEDYARVSDLTVYDVKRKSLFTTKAEEEPWAVLELAGDVIVKGVTIVGDADAPLKIWMQEADGDWQEIGGGKPANGMLRIDLRKRPPRVKSVKVGFGSSDAKRALALKKILVYGDRLF